MKTSLGFSQSFLYVEWFKWDPSLRWGLDRMISLDSVLPVIKEQNSVFYLFTCPLSSNSVSFVSWHVGLEVYVCSLALTICC